MMERSIEELVGGELDQCDNCGDLVKSNGLREGLCEDCVNGVQDELEEECYELLRGV